MPLPTAAEVRLRAWQATALFALVGLLGAAGFVDAQFDAIDRYQSVLRAHLRDEARTPGATPVRNAPPRTCSAATRSTTRRARSCAIWCGARAGSDLVRRVSGPIFERDKAGSAGCDSVVPSMGVTSRARIPGAVVLLATVGPVLLALGGLAAGFSPPGDVDVIVPAFTPWSLSGSSGFSSRARQAPAGALVLRPARAGPCPFARAVGSCPFPDSCVWVRFGFRSVPWRVLCGAALPGIGPAGCPLPLAGCRSAVRCAAAFRRRRFRCLSAGVPGLCA